MLKQASRMAGLLLLVTAGALHAQLPPPERSLPAGFRISNTVNNGMQVGYEATKSQSWPKCFDTLPSEVRLGWTWQKMPGATQFISLIARAPEEPLSRTGMTLDEPAGKEMLRGGSLVWRRTTVPCMGYGEKPPLVTWDVKWIGAWNEGMLAVAVHNAIGTKPEIKAWVEQVLAPMLGGSTATAPARAAPPPTRPPARRGTPGR